MKKITGYFLAFSLVLALPLAKVWAQAKPFEGTITWTMTMPQMGNDDSHSMIINVKGKKTEAEMDMGAMGKFKTYSDDATKKAYMVMGAMKSGFIMDLQADSISAATQLDSIALKPTGGKATIAGHPAEEYLLTGIESRGQKIDLSIWVTADFPKEIQESFFRSLNDKPGQDPKQMKAMKMLASRGLVPVRIVAKSGDDVEMTMEFVKYEKKHLDDALFVPPTDVKYRPMPTMGGGMN